MSRRGREFELFQVPLGTYELATARAVRRVHPSESIADIQRNAYLQGATDMAQALLAQEQPSREVGWNW